VKISELGELDLIRRLGRITGDEHLGDDTAVLPGISSSKDMILTTDALVEGVHFLSNTDPELVGRKAVARVLSDFASMGASPLWFLVNLALPANMEADQVETAYEGIRTLLEKTGGSLVGGDVTQSEQYQFHVFGVGEVAKGTALRRSTAKVYDTIYVTGVLGDSFASGHHLEFSPRLDEGKWLIGKANSCIDLSDGLGTDLRHLLQESGFSAQIDLDHIPCRGSLEQAFSDGEDFELCFTSSQPDLENAWPFETRLTRIGTVIVSEDEKHGHLQNLGGDAIDAEGFAHFEKRSR